MGDWWKDHFSGMWIDFLRDHWSDEQNGRQAAQMLRLLKITAPAKILDVPCGDGRLAVEFAAAGHAATGIDLSPAFLAAARQRAVRRRVRVDWQQGNLLDLSLPQAFDAVVCANGSFGYFDDEQNAAFLQTVARGLRSGAGLLLEMPTVDTILPKFKPQESSRSGDLLLQEEHFYDHIEGRLRTQSILARNGCVQSSQRSVRLYTVHEACRLLHSAGLAEVEVFGSLEGDPLTFDSYRTVLVATRRFLGRDGPAATGITASNLVPGTQ